MPSKSTSGNTIETVDNWLHLGHVISKDCNDCLDILSRRGSFISQVNNIVCMFGKLDCVTKMKLFKAYCCSFYGCELWDLSNIAVQTL